MQLQWTSSLPVTSFYAAGCVARGWPVLSPEAAAELAAPAAELELRLAELPLGGSVWERVAGLARDYPAGDELARRILTLAGRGDADPGPLSEPLRAIAAAGRRLYPDFLEQAAHRMAPLRQQWEARGPGLLRSMRRLTHQELFVESAGVVLTAPICGGGGVAYLEGNQVIFEAVLTHVDDRLPEPLRLAWLLSQLNLDLPAFSENIPLAVRGATSQLAMLPVVLTAAEDVELARWNEGSLELALRLWRLPHRGDSALADALFSWWETYLEQRPSFATALPALARLLPPLS